MSHEILYEKFKIFNLKNFMIGLALLGWLILTIRKIQVAELSYVSSAVKSLKRVKKNDNQTVWVPWQSFQIGL